MKKERMGQYEFMTQIHEGRWSFDRVRFTEGIRLGNPESTHLSQDAIELPTLFFSDCRFDGGVVITGVRIQQFLTFEESRFCGDVLITAAHVDRLRLNRSKKTVSRVSIASSHIEHGELHRSKIKVLDIGAGNTAGRMSLRKLKVGTAVFHTKSFRDFQHNEVDFEKEPVYH